MPAQPAYRADVVPYSGEIAGLLYDGLQSPRRATLRLDAGVVTDISDIGDITDTGDVEDRDLTTMSEPLIVPGFVDLHNHGGAGGGFPNGTVEECIEAALYHRPTVLDRGHGYSNSFTLCRGCTLYPQDPGNFRVIHDPRYLKYPG